MATPTITVVTETGTTASLSPGSSSAAIYTCPVSTTARLCAFITRGPTLFPDISILVNDKLVRWIDSLDAWKLTTLQDKFIYLVAGDIVKLKNEDAAITSTLEYYLNFLERA